jgi:hypothetical protein
MPETMPGALRMQWPSAFILGLPLNRFRLWGAAMTVLWLDPTTAIR